MDALIMAGGRGERMGSAQPKPLIPFNGKPLIQWSVQAASGCAYIDRVFVALTKDTVGIKEVAGAEVVVTEGRGYVEDVVSAIRQLGLRKVLVLSADLPFITSSDLEWVVKEYEKLGTPALAVFVPVSVCKELGAIITMEMDGLVPAGVNVVNGKNIDGEESRLVATKPSFAFNINTPIDLERAVQFVKKSY